MPKNSVVRRNAFLYAAVLVLFGAGIYGIVHLGSGLQSTQAAGDTGGVTGGIGEALHENLRHPLSVLLLQVVVILVASRLTGSVV